MRKIKAGRTEQLGRDEGAVELLLHELERATEAFSHIRGGSHQCVIGTANLSLQTAAK